MTSDDIVVADEGEEQLAAMVEEGVGKAMSGTAEDVVIMAANGGGATNEASVAVHIDKVEVHVHERD